MRNYSVARQRANLIRHDKDFLNLVLQLEMLADTEWHLQPEARHGSLSPAAPGDIN
jgi:hypothetical protein